MFEYDRLALNVAEHVARIRFRTGASSPRQTFDPFRAHTVRSFSPSGLDVFDCGASSGYGSPGIVGTPLSSPAPHIFSLPSHVQHALCDPSLDDETENIASLGPTVVDHGRSKKVF
ncbi:unnamed protein product [Gongylonema pulchrum]|uniref:FtsJ domain-containing protein n=1 Tax=Gongylonema pulchrum TaxID=637853 RepID=A0A183D1Z2_9BILA|nr:unnamed protein product [Gongylonema pulchrum]